MINAYMASPFFLKKLQFESYLCEKRQLTFSQFKREPFSLRQMRNGTVSLLFTAESNRIKTGHQ